jgi:alpha/beta superfamily hydrolase
MGRTRNLTIEGPTGRIQAALRHTVRPRAAAVVAHPHPLHGGTLHNPVIFHSDRELNRAQFVTMRFNFRGVEESEGVHDGGQGEVDDLAAAVGWLRGVVFDVPLVLVGFSFGSICAIRYALGDPEVVGIVAIGLPVKRYPLPDLAAFRRPLTVVQGELDEFGGPEEVRHVIDPLEPPGQLLTVDSATHLFPGTAPLAGELVAQAAMGIVADLE